MKQLFTGRYSWIESVVNELNELDGRTSRLHAYLSSSRSVDENSELERKLLMEQERVMIHYGEILSHRIELGITKMVKERGYLDDEPHEI